MSINTYYSIDNAVDKTTGDASKGNTGKADLGKDDFLKLLVTELRSQNPLEPLDSKDYIAQLAQFSSLEQMQNLNLQMASLSAVNVVGKTARALDEKGENEISGQIKGVVFANGKINLIIGEDEMKVPMENVIEIR